MLLDCYSDARVTKSTGNKPGEKDVFTNLFASICHGKETQISIEKSLASEKIRFDNNAGNWASAFKHVLVFLGDDNPTIQEIDDIWLEEFRSYLLEVDKRSGKPRLSSSTALSYFNRVRTALTTAYERRIIERNPANLARPIRAENSMREFLTLNEVKRLVETKCDQPVLKLHSSHWTEMVRHRAPNLGGSKR